MTSSFHSKREKEREREEGEEKGRKRNRIMKESKRRSTILRSEASF